jgi:AcrR family transcriptional regulator
MDVAPVRRLTPEMRRLQTRSYLLEAAAAVFAARGFTAASLDEVAHAAGYTKGAIYSHFGSKAELFLALVEEREQAMRTEYLAAANSTAEPDDKLRAIIAAGGRFAPTAAEWALWQEFQLYALRNPALRERLIKRGSQRAACCDGDRTTYPDRQPGPPADVAPRDPCRRAGPRSRLGARQPHRGLHRLPRRHPAAQSALIAPIPIATQHE